MDPVVRTGVVRQMHVSDCWNGYHCRALHNGWSLRCFVDKEALLDEVGGSVEWSSDGSKTHEEKEESETGRTVVKSQLMQEALIEIADQFAMVVGSVGR